MLISIVRYKHGVHIWEVVHVVWVEVNVELMDYRETEESENESTSASSNGLQPKKCRSGMWNFYIKMPCGKKVLSILYKNEYSYLGVTWENICFTITKISRNEMTEEATEKNKLD